jgi:peptidyl-prolyl cis-trans isomerase D
MISKLRHYSESWIAKVFFVIMAISFVGWGISGDLFRLMGPPSWVAKVGGETIEIPAFQAEYQRALAQQTRDLPSGQEATADLRRRVGQQTLARMIGEAALGKTLNELRIVTPDEALAVTIRAMPAFKGPDGSFSKSQFESVLRNNGYTEARFGGGARYRGAAFVHLGVRKAGRGYGVLPDVGRARSGSPR